MVDAEGPDQQTPDLASIISEITSSANSWNSGNALVIIISGSGVRVAHSYDGSPAQAPLLHVGYGGGASSPPAAASGLTALMDSESKLDLAWFDNSSDENGFKIERSPDGFSYNVISTVPADALSYSDTGLPPCAEYFYRVVAYNTAGDASPSNADSASTDGCGGPAAAPVITVTPTTTDLQLVCPTVNGKTYTLYRNNVTPDLSDGGWVQASPSFPGDGAPMMFTVPKPASGKVFYTIEYTE